MVYEQGARGRRCKAQAQASSAGFRDAGKGGSGRCWHIFHACLTARVPGQLVAAGVSSMDAGWGRVVVYLQGDRVRSAGFRGEGAHVQLLQP